MASVVGRGDGSVDDARAGVLRRLRARRSEIEEVIFARVRDVSPDAMGLGDHEYVAGLRAATTAAMDYVLEGIAEERESDRSEIGQRIPLVVVEQARRAARVGVGLDTVLRRYVAGLAILEDFIMQEADHSAFVGQRTAVRRVLETSASLLDRLIPSIIGAYMQESEPAERSPLVTDRSALSAGQESGTRRISRRDRILQAMVEVVAERGFTGTSVGLVVARARVSRRTFEREFSSLEECLGAVFDLGRERTVELVSEAFAGQETWQDGVRMALASLLVFLDSEPLLTRVWLVESLAAGSWALEHRERNLRALRDLVLSSWPPSDEWSSPPMAAEGVIASVLGIVHAHIVAGKPEPLIELLGPLMGLVAAPYLGARGVQREIERADELARAIGAGDSSWARAGAAAWGMAGQGAVLPAMLENPRASRARECLLFLAEHPDSSNRELAVGIGVAHESQISRLLAYLLQEGLVTKRSEGRGKRNAWRLTERGEEVAECLSGRHLNSNG